MIGQVIDLQDYKVRKNFVVLRHSGRAGILLFHSSQVSTDYITIGGFSTYITIPRITTPTHWRIY